MQTVRAFCKVAGYKINTKIVIIYSRKTENIMKEKISFMTAEKKITCLGVNAPRNLPEIDTVFLRHKIDLNEGKDRPFL